MSQKYIVYFSTGGGAVSNGRRVSAMPSIYYSELLSDVISKTNPTCVCGEIFILNGYHIDIHTADGTSGFDMSEDLGMKALLAQAIKNVFRSQAVVGNENAVLFSTKDEIVQQLEQALNKFSVLLRKAKYSFEDLNTIDHTHMSKDYFRDGCFTVRFTDGELLQVQKLLREQGENSASAAVTSGIFATAPSDEDIEEDGFVLVTAPKHS